MVLTYIISFRHQEMRLWKHPQTLHGLREYSYRVKEIFLNEQIYKFIIALKLVFSQGHRESNVIIGTWGKGLLVILRPAWIN